MQKFKTLSDAKALARFAHFHQKDKAGLPYIEHPLRVLVTVQARGCQPYVQMAAVLHDVPEDTAFSHDILLALGFSEAVVELTRLLDRGYSEKVWRQRRIHQQRLIESWSDLDADEFRLAMSQWDDKHGSLTETADEFYYTRIKQSREATIIKLADIADNMAPWRQAYLSEETQNRLKAKYAKALEILNPAPVNHGMLTGYVHDPYYLP